MKWGEKEWQRRQKWLFRDSGESLHWRRHHTYFESLPGLEGRNPWILVNSLSAPGEGLVFIGKINVETFMSFAWPWKQIFLSEFLFVKSPLLLYTSALPSFLLERPQKTYYIPGKEPTCHGCEDYKPEQIPLHFPFLTFSKFIWQNCSAFPPKYFYKM